jgi:putative copper resistance protein D
VSIVVISGVVRWFTLSATAAVLGALVVVAFVLPRPTPAGPARRLRRWTTAAAIVLLLGVGAELILRTQAMTGSTSAALLTGVPVVVAKTHFGRIWLVRAAAIGAILLLAARASRGARGAALGLAAVVSLTTALTGHLADWGDLTPSVGLDWAHVMAAGTWTGGLAALALATMGMRGSVWETPALAATAARFSRLAGYCLLVVALTGAYNAWVQLPGVAALWTTGYGRLLGIKILVVLALAALGAINRYAIVARLGVGSLRSPAARIFRRARLIVAGPAGPRAALAARFATYVAAEAGLAIVVLACTAALGESPPARHAMHLDHHHVAEPAGPVRISMDALHAQGGVPSNWLFVPPPGDAGRGREVFVTRQCYACHTVAGEGFPAPTGAGPELTGMGAHHPAGYLAESVLNPNAVILEGPGYTGPDGRSTMPDYRQSLTLADFIDLVAYLRTLAE